MSSCSTGINLSFRYFELEYLLHLPKFTPLKKVRMAVRTSLFVLYRQEFRNMIFPTHAVRDETSFDVMLEVTSLYLLK